MSSALDLAASVLAAAALAWLAIAAAARLDLQRWVWLPAFRAGAALSLAATGLLVLGLPVPVLAAPLLGLGGLAVGLAAARWPRLTLARTGGAA